MSKSTALLQKLESGYNFHLIEKIVKLYGETEQIYQPLFDKVVSLMARKLPLEAALVEGEAVGEGLSPREMDMFHSVRKDLWAMLAKLLSYSYPKLKGLEVNAGDNDRISFHINVPGVMGESLTFSTKKTEDQEDAEDRQLQ